jgi:hypothetical protein
MSSPVTGEKTHVVAEIPLQATHVTRSAAKATFVGNVSGQVNKVHVVKFSYNMPDVLRRQYQSAFLKGRHIRWNSST